MQEGELDDGRSPTRTSKLREGTVGVGGPSRGRKRTLDESEVSSEVSVNSAATRPNKKLHSSRTRRSSSAGTRSVNNVRASDFYLVAATNAGYGGALHT